VFDLSRSGSPFEPGSFIFIAASLRRLAKNCLSESHILGEAFELPLRAVRDSERRLQVGREKLVGDLNQDFSRYPHKRHHQRQTKGVAVTVNCNGPRLTLTTLITYIPLWLTVELSTATPLEASTVCTATPEGFTSTSLYGTFRLDSATTDISCAPAGTVKPLLEVCPAEALPDWFVVVPGPVVGCVVVTEFCKQKLST
jgi:hypothetical protein